MSFQQNRTVYQDGRPPVQDQKKKRALPRRDYHRMNRYNEAKIEEADPNGWAERSVSSMALEESKPKWRQNRPQQQQKPVNSRPANRNNVFSRSTVADKPVDEDLYPGGIEGARPNRKTLTQNFDYASFASVVKATHDQTKIVEPRLDQMCPFPVFQHAMVEILTARLLAIQRDELRHPDLVNLQDPLDAIRAQDLLAPSQPHECLFLHPDLVRPPLDPFLLYRKYLWILLQPSSCSNL